MNNVSNLNQTNTPNQFEPPESLDWPGRFELWIGFFRFHNKKLIGFILICGVAALVYKLSIQSDDSKIAVSAKEDNAVQKTDPAVPAPLTQSLEAERRGDGIISEKATISDTLSEFENQSINQLVEKSIKIHRTWGKEIPSIGIVLCQERARISQHLLTHSLTESQRIFAITSYIDAVSLVDSLNVSSKMNVAGTSDSLAEIDVKYSSHSNDDISAKANLAISLAPLYAFMVTATPEQANLFESECRQRIAKIAKNNSALTRLADLAIAAHNRLGADSTSGKTFENLAELMLELPDPQSHRIALQYREHLLYDRFDPRTIALIGSEKDPAARQEVKDFFQTLSEHPDSSPKIYRTAVDIIKTFRRLGRTEDAIRLTQWLEQITDQIPVNQNQELIKKVISEAINETTQSR
ncbi:MAG: hypothetical protein OSA89_03220 [Mariniblastus sp.]|nr:hypothetical protein [Mariniblastus sp.]